MEILNFRRDLLKTVKCDLSTFAKTCFNYDECKLRVVGCPHDDPEDESVVQTADSASRVTGYTATTNKSCEIRRIELAKRRAKLKASFELAEAREARARAEAQAKVENAEMLAKLRIGVVQKKVFFDLFFHQGA